MKFKRLKKSEVSILHQKNRYKMANKEMKTYTLAEMKDIYIGKEQLGELIGVQKSQISKLESSANSATIDTIIKVFKALKAEINFRVKLENEFVQLV